MKSKHGVLCYKIFTSEQVDVASIEFPAISETVRQVIREAKLESLQGLLGEDWQGVAHELAKEYWGLR
ncbi:hypothetical protein ES703_56474 [subsurface metagenome]